MILSDQKVSGLILSPRSQHVNVNLKSICFSCYAPWHVSLSVKWTLISTWYHATRNLIPGPCIWCIKVPLSSWITLTSTFFFISTKNGTECYASAALVHVQSVQVADRPGKQIAFPWVELLREPRYYFPELICVFPLSQKLPHNILIAARMDSHMQLQVLLMTWHLNPTSDPWNH